MNTKRKTIDITPESLRTPEGVARVNAALEQFISTTGEVAHVASSFLEEWGAELASIMTERNSEFGPALDDLVRAVQGREEAQEAMLRAIAGR